MNVTACTMSMHCTCVHLFGLLKPFCRSEVLFVFSKRSSTLSFVLELKNKLWSFSKERRVKHELHDYKIAKSKNLHDTEIVIVSSLRITVNLALEFYGFEHNYHQPLKLLMLQLKMRENF